MHVDQLQQFIYSLCNREAWFPKSHLASLKGLSATSNIIQSLANQGFTNDGTGNFSPGFASKKVYDSVNVSTVSILGSSVYSGSM